MRKLKNSGARTVVAKSALFQWASPNAATIAGAVEAQPVSRWKRRLARTILQGPPARLARATSPE
jgi:hypothetical protein